MKNLLLIATFFLVQHAFAQQEIDISKAKNCKNAIELNLAQQFGPTTAPATASLVTRVPNGGLIYFEKQQHLVWYKFTTEKTGKLAFEISPTEPSDNYDFILFKNEANICEKIKSGKIKAISSNFAKSDQTIQGTTGLAITPEDDSYSPAIRVKAGDVYYLVLNSVYDGGSGHSINFKYYESFKMHGNISNILGNRPIQVYISWTNERTGDVLASTTSDEKGNYVLDASVGLENHQFPNYTLSIYSEKFFLVDSTFAYTNLGEIKGKKFDFKLRKIRKGKNPSLENMYFEPNSGTEIVSSSEKVLKKLYKQLLLNESLIIQLEGHSNGIFPSTEIDDRLSKERTKTIKNYFVVRGINPERIKTKSFGSTRLIYPKAKNEFEESRNRRVETTVLDF